MENCSYRLKSVRGMARQSLMCYFFQKNVQREICQLDDMVTDEYGIL